ncbi:MAG: hypothetical protein ABFD16_20405 [Thermoguttaceae bacterium]
MNRGPREELFALMGALVNDTITPDDYRRLEALLLRDAEARQFYFDYLDIHFGLHDWQLRDEEAAPLAALRQQLDASSPTAARPAQNRQWLRYAMVIAATLCVSFVLQFLWDAWSAAGVTALHDYVATLVKTADCQWAPGDNWREGSRLAPGEFRLVDGVVEIRFDSGAQLVVQGPAALKIESTSMALLKQGKVVLKSDETAEAFVLHTPSSTLIDRGTEYAVSVSPTGEEVHVFDGEVQRQPKGKAVSVPEPIPAGQAKQYNRTTVAKGTPVPLSEARFVRQVPEREAPPSPTANLLAYEGFDYPSPLPANGAAGGLGWANPWSFSKEPAVTFSAAGLDRTDARTAALGGAIDFAGVGSLSRRLDRPIASDKDGIYYFSFLFRRYAGEAKTPNAFSLNFHGSPAPAPQKKLVVGIGESNHILFVHLEGGGARTPLPLEYEKTYLLIGKIVTAKSRPDQVFMRVYRPDEPVLAKEPGSWSIASRPVQSNLVFDSVTIAINSPTRQMLDEFRLGTTWASVTSAWAR